MQGIFFQKKRPKNSFFKFFNLKCGKNPNKKWLPAKLVKCTSIWILKASVSQVTLSYSIDGVSARCSTRPDVGGFKKTSLADTKTPGKFVLNLELYYTKGVSVYFDFRMVVKFNAARQKNMLRLIRSWQIFRTFGRLAIGRYSIHYQTHVQKCREFNMYILC